MPRRASALFGDSGWLRRLLAAATGDAGQADRLAEGFLALFPGHVDDAAREELRDFARTGLKAQGRRGRGRVAAPPGGPAGPDRGHRPGDERADRDRPGAARPSSGNSPRNGAACQRRIGEIGRTDAHGALVDLGLLPNYSLIDVSTTLEATLTWQEDDSRTAASSTTASCASTPARPSRR